MAASLAVLGYGTTLTHAAQAFLEVVKISGPNIKCDLKEVSNMGSPNTYKEFIAGFRDGGQVTFEGNYIPKNIGQVFLNTDINAGTSASWTLVLAGALGTWTFTAFVEMISPTIPLDDRMTVAVTLKITGQPVLT